MDKYEIIRCRANVPEDRIRDSKKIYILVHFQNINLLLILEISNKLKTIKRNKLISRHLKYKILSEGRKKLFALGRESNPLLLLA